MSSWREVLFQKNTSHFQSNPPTKNKLQASSLAPIVYSIKYISQLSSTPRQSKQTNSLPNLTLSNNNNKNTTPKPNLLSRRENHHKPNDTPTTHPRFSPKHHLPLHRPHIHLFLNPNRQSLLPTLPHRHRLIIRLLLYHNQHHIPRPLKHQQQP